MHSSKQSDPCFQRCLSIYQFESLCTATWAPLAFYLLPKWKKSLCILVKLKGGSRVSWHSVLKRRRTHLWALCCLSRIPCPLLYLLLQIRNALSESRVLEGTNSKQQSDDITSHSGCPGYRCLLRDWSRVALSQVKDLPLLLLSTAKGYIGCSMFKSNLRLSLIWNIQIVGALSETWLCWTLRSIRADSSHLHVEFSLGCWLYSHRVFPGRITVLTPSLPLALAPPPPQECFYSLKRSSSQDWLHVWAAPFLSTSFCSPVLVSVLELQMKVLLHSLGMQYAEGRRMSAPRYVEPWSDNWFYSLNQGALSPLISWTMHSLLVPFLSFFF